MVRITTVIALLFSVMMLGTSIGAGVIAALVPTAQGAIALCFACLVFSGIAIIMAYCDSDR
jgi:hypothetical protein